MGDVIAYALYAALLGVGATVTLDLWAPVRRCSFDVPVPDYGLVGRWIAYLPRGRFHHDPIAAAPPVQGERALGWIAHYLIGVLFAAVLLACWGLDWMRHPTPGPALLVGVSTVVAPYLILQPGMGLGIAARRARNPAVARLHSLVAHAVFGLGLYFTAWVFSLSRF